MKILIFYTQAGGGHKNAAFLLASFLNQHEVKIVDLGNDNPITNWFYTDGYVLLTEKLTWLWALLTMFWKTRIGQFISKQVFKSNHRRTIKKEIDSFKPDKIVSTYFFSSSISNQYNPSIPAYYLVSEIFGAPVIWFDSNKVKYIVASQTIYQQGLDQGIFANNLIPFTEFFKPANSNLTFEIPNSNYDKKILIVGGGSSLPKGVELTKKLLNSQLNYQFYIVTGSNYRLKNRLKQLTSKDPRFIILGFVDYLPSLIKQVDVIISKAGPAIITEVLSAKKPIILYHYYWEQEKPNVEFIVNNNFGIYTPDLTKLVNGLPTILMSTKWQQCITNAKEHKFENSIKKIAQYIVE